MTDSLTASMKWCRYDDDFKERNGFRLPAGKAIFRYNFFPYQTAIEVARYLAGADSP